MPTYKISQLTTATAVSATNQFEINQNGTSKSVAVSVIDAYIKSTSNLPVVVSVSSATDAVRITQTGTGNALVVEDAANPDSSPFVIDASGNVGIGTTAPASKLDVSGAIRDSKGDVRTIVQNAQTAAYVLVVGDAGKHISITTGGVTVNSGIFSAGDAISIFNNSASSQTITQGASVTMYLGGTATTGNRTLAQRGICTILCVASNTFVISGAGLT